nr:hypothetical protein [Gaetbulibacter sp. 4G1]
MCLFNENMFSRISMLFFLILAANSVNVNGQVDSISEVEKKFDSFMSNNQTVLTDSLSYYSDLREIKRFKLEIAKEEYFEKQYSNYFTDNLRHREETFNWQLFSSKVIFFTVIVIVLCGLIFSGIKFHQSIKLNKALSKLENEESIEKILKLNSADKTEVELSINNGLKMTSSIIGLIILFISIAFFYLYILYVYPINQLKIDNSNFNMSETHNNKNITTQEKSTKTQK